MSQDLYQAPDYFLMDELLTDEHKLIEMPQENGSEEKYRQLLKMLVKNVNFQNKL